MRFGKPVPATKWNKDVTKKLPVYEAAFRTLRARLYALIYWLPLATENPEEDIEYVHQLRVSTRRAFEATKIFYDLIPREKAEDLKSVLRKIRLAADDARNLDVLGAQFVLGAERMGQSTCTRIVNDIKNQRNQAQQPIEDVFRELQAEDFFESVDDILEQVHTCRRSSVVQPIEEQASSYVKAPLKKFIRAMRHDLSDDEAFHNLRIRGKKLRYSMEVVAFAFPSSFRKQLYPQLVLLQDLMGLVNDHATAVQLFRSWMESEEDVEKKSFFEGMLVAEMKSHHDIRHMFLSEWTPEEMKKLREDFARQSKQIGTRKKSRRSKSQ